MLLDVSEALTDPLLFDEFQYVRRTEEVNDRGRSVVSEVIMPCVGTICSASANDLMRIPEMDRMGRNLSIVTQTRLKGPSEDSKADVVVWRGGRYVVKWVDVYSHAGSGFIQAIAGSLESVDTPNE